MREELKGLTKDLKKFLSAAEEEDFILKAAPHKQKAAFNISAKRQDAAQETQEEQVTAMQKISRFLFIQGLPSNSPMRKSMEIPHPQASCTHCFLLLAKFR